MEKPKEKEIKISFHKYRSAKSLIYEWGYLNKTCPTTQKIPLKQFTNHNEEGPVQIAIDIVLKRKIWGFYRYGNPSEIHFWFHKSCNNKQIMNLLAHEIAHASGYKSENSAIKVAAISTFAQYILNKYSKRK